MASLIVVDCDWHQMPGNVLEHSLWAQITYGATIASFLGGVHWGAAMLDPRRKAFWFSPA